LLNTALTSLVVLIDGQFYLIMSNGRTGTATSSVVTINSDSFSGMSLRTPGSRQPRLQVKGLGEEDHLMPARSVLRQR
jgi:hypothetical protein